MKQTGAYLGRLMWQRLIAAGVVIVLGAAVPGFSQSVRDDDTVPAAGVRVEPSPAQAGQDVRLVVTIPLKSGLHVYGPKVKQPYYATNVSIRSQGPIIWNEEASYPPAIAHETMGETIPVIEPDPKTGAVTITVAGRIEPGTPSDRYPVEAKLTYQVCSTNTCFPPVVNKTVETTVIVGNGPTTNIVERAGPVSSPVDVHGDGFGSTFSFFGYQIDLNQAGIWLPLVVAFVAGLLLNIMPCVLPVIPIKILQLSKQAHQEHHSPIRLSMVFAGGVVSFFVLIGIIALVLQNGFSWGQSFQNPTVIIGICLVLLVLALGMFDVYQISVPSFIANKEVVRKGYLGAFSMGFLAGILSTPCSFGILGAAIAWAQGQTHRSLTMVTFITIGVGMASPYVILSGFPNLVKKIPHTGRWSILFKEAMGFVLLGVVAFLVSALPKDRILSTLLFFLVFSFIIWFWGEVLEFRREAWARIGRVGVLIGLVITGWMMLKPAVEDLEWERLDVQTLETAKAAGQDIVVDFTADWCLNCRTVDFLVFGNERVKAALKDKKVKPLKADLTEDNVFATDALKKWTGQSGIPFTVVLKGDGRKILLPGIYNKEALIKALE